MEQLFGSPKPVAVVHYLSGVSYLHRRSNGQNGLDVGERWWWGSEFNTVRPWLEARVDAIDAVNRTAKITIRHRPETGHTSI